MPKSTWEFCHARGIGLLDICQEVHMCVTGSSDCLSWEHLAELVSVLRLAVADWDPKTIPCAAAFDGLVLLLIKQTLEDYEKSWWAAFVAKEVTK